MIVNCTPHPIRLYHLDHDELLDEIPPSGQVARLSTFQVTTEDHDGFPVALVAYGAEAELPPEQEGVWYIVSLPTALAVMKRRDLLVPYDEVRNEQGTMIGCRMLARPV